MFSLNTLVIDEGIIVGRDLTLADASGAGRDTVPLNILDAGRDVITSTFDLIGFVTS